MCYQCDCIDCVFYVHDCSLIPQLTTDLERRLTAYDALLAENLVLKRQVQASQDERSVLTYILIILSILVYELALPWIAAKLTARFANGPLATVIAVFVMFSPRGIVRLLGIAALTVYDIVNSRNQRRRSYTVISSLPVSHLPSDLETMPLTQASGLPRCGSESSFHSIKSDTL